MRVEAIRPAFEKSGPFSSGGPAKHLSCRITNEHHVHAINGQSRDAKGQSKVGKLLYRQGLMHRSRDGITVVIAHKQERELPQSCEVQGLMDGSRTAGPVAKDAGGHPGVSIHLGSQGDAGRHGEVAAHHGMSAKEAVPGLRDVAPPALALTGAVRSSKEFCHHGTRVQTASQGRANRPPATQQLVLGPKSSTNSNRDSLFPGREQLEPGARQTHQLPLEGANEHHGAQHTQEVGPVLQVECARGGAITFQGGRFVW